MPKKKNKRIKLSDTAKKRIKYDLILIGLTAILLIFSTYSWFITLNDLTIEKFQVEVKSEKGLTISFDGVNFEKELTLSRDNMESYYMGNTNKYPYTGLTPMSTTGIIDNETSRVKMFSKHSLLASNGGYRFTTLYGNEKEERSGYLVFDLFFKNNSGGNKYYPEKDSPADYITLQKESFVRIETDEEARDRTKPGQPVPEGGDGLENGIRVGFFSIGKANKAAPVNTILGINCKNPTINGEKVTSLCDGEQFVTWNIWEPNDRSHTIRAKEDFDKMCRKRIGIDTYGGVCNSWELNDYVTTYAVNDKINGKDFINMYDGLNEYNNISPKIKKMSYYTDTESKETHEGLLSLGMNSITKVRVYVYLEGQDVDTVEYAKMEKKIIIQMSFSKGDIFSDD